LRIALGIEYDGTSYNGWQRQKTGIGVQQRLEKALSVVANETVDSHHLGVDDLPAADPQEVRGHLRGPFARLADLLDVGALGVVGDHPCEKLAIAVDRRQEVVEIVGDATGQAADRFHLLRLAELLVEPVLVGPLLGDVQEALDASAFVGAAANRLARVLPPALGAALSRGPDRELPKVAALGVAREHRVEKELRIDEETADTGQDLSQILPQVLVAPSQQGFRGTVGPHQAKAGIGDQDRHLEVLQHVAEDLSGDLGGGDGRIRIFRHQRTLSEALDFSL